jgi:uncharacterized protein YjbJ (UPF0337 family)
MNRDKQTDGTHQKHQFPAKAEAHVKREPAAKASGDKHEASGHAAKAVKAPAVEVNPLETHWKQICTKMKEKWASLTDDDLRFLDKTKAALIAKVHERTGLESDTTERQVDQLIASIAPSAA